MKERQILFRAPMVRAILEGRKTMTRRVVKAPEWFEGHKLTATTQVNGETKYHDVVCSFDGGDQLFCPYGVPGDRLWVRETFSVHKYYDGRSPAAVPDAVNVEYKAGGDRNGRNGIARGDKGRWRQSIHMPRWASRITLEVTGVRVERLHGMSRGDAMAEGCPFKNMAEGDDPRQWFAELWDEINGRGVRKVIGGVTVQTHDKKHRKEMPDVSWDTNPWVWVVEFRRVAR